MASHISVRDASILVNRGPDAIKKLLQAGKVKGEKDGNRWIVNREDLLEHYGKIENGAGKAGIDDARTIEILCYGENLKPFIQGHVPETIKLNPSIARSVERVVTIYEKEIERLKYKCDGMEKQIETANHQIVREREISTIEQQRFGKTLESLGGVALSLEKIAQENSRLLIEAPKSKNGNINTKTNIYFLVIMILILSSIVLFRIYDVSFFLHPGNR